MTRVPDAGDRSQQRKLAMALRMRQHDGKMTRELLLHPGRHGLGMLPSSIQAEQTTTAVCGFCSTGCGLRLHLRDGLAVGLTPNPGYPVNRGTACPKGWEALRVLDATDRATQPLLRNERGELQPVNWDTALRTFTSRFKAIQAEHGAESVAFLSTGQIASEEMVMLGMLAKFGMGLVHGDGNTRQCMATAATAYKESFGFDAPPYTYEDFELSDCLVFIGANPCIAHPIMWERVLANRNKPDIIVVDPRRTETAMAATEHLQLAPKTDLILLLTLSAEIIRQGLVDKPFVDAHTVGYEEMADAVSGYTVERASAATGLSPAQIQHVAERIGTGRAVSLWWTMGVNQSYDGTRTAQAIINLALLTGNIGKPGTGANSITGQCNAMGSRLWSNTTSLLGHHQFGSSVDRHKVSSELGIPESRIPDHAGWTYDQIMEGIARREIRGLWVIATNPAHSWIHQANARRLLEQLDFLVVQDMYHSTETAQQASLVLPAAGWGEKRGTMINSERRYGVLQKVRQAPGEALADFQIFRAIGRYWGLGEWFTRWNQPEEVFGLMKRLSAGTPSDISGIGGYEDIQQRGGIQWPWTAADAAAGKACETHRRLFAEGQFYHADRRARFVVGHPSPMPEAPDAEYPLLLVTGRGTVSQWHTQTRTSKSALLRQLYPQEVYVELNPLDAARYRVGQGDLVEVRSRRGSAQARVWSTATVRPGQAFMPMHYWETNRLTLAHFDPQSRQPSYKDCAVSIHPVELPGTNSVRRSV